MIAVAVAILAAVAATGYLVGRWWLIAIPALAMVIGGPLVGRDVFAPATTHAEDASTDLLVYGLVAVIGVGGGVLVKRVRRRR